MKKIFIPVSALFTVGLSHAQTLNLSTNENYVYTKTYLTDPSLANPKSVETVQYIDGLGRPKQVVNIKASPTQKDVVTHIVYDGFGRQVKDYLPVPQSNTLNGAIVPNPLANATQPDVYGSEKFYAEKILENSPLDRIQQQVQVGTDWSGKPVKFEYDANIAGEVKKYTATFNYSTFSSQITLSAAGYTANQLYKNTVTDEDGNKTVEFKNGQGQTVLVRKMLSATEKADTYYVYNDYNQLAYVIPPLAVAANAVDAATLNNLCYQYKYDARNRLVEKKLPGKGWEYMLYDKQDRLVATRDANLEAKGQWLFTKYDQFGRVALTGISTGGSRTAEQAEVETFGTNSVPRISSTSFTLSGMDVHYRGFLAYPADSKYVQLLSVSYYDTYASYSFNPAFPSTVLGVPIITDNSTGNTVSTKSLPVMSFVKNIEDDNWTKNYTWYDNRGRALASHSINHLGGYTKTESELDFSGTPKQVVTRHKRLETDTERVITETFTYDHQNRLLVHTHKVDNQPVEYLAQNEYNELSQLKTKKVGGTNASTPLQSIDYQYNIRGWLTKINDPASLGSDLFGYKIKYNQVEGQETPNTDFMDLKVKPKYNGNIAEVDWKTNTTTGDYLRRYGYVYDGLNRLLAGFYQKDTNPAAREYFEKIMYDLNGNITNLKRSEGMLAGSGTAMTIDNLNYSYTGNRLNSVTDISGQYNGYPDTSGNTITYDDNGNMKDHIDKGLLQIDYNFLNLPNYIMFKKGLSLRSGIVRNNLFYQYRADGVKLKKIYNYAPSNPSGQVQELETKITEYIDEFQYEGKNVTVVGPKGGITKFITSLQFRSTSEGYFDFEKNKYIYNYTDHLGNVRLSYLNNGSSIEVLEENNYYPFGLKHEGYNALAGNPSYQYKYNGKELQETGMYAMDFRHYMPDIGRFTGMDRLSEILPTLTPYRFGFDNPVNFSDPTGLFETRREAREYRREHDISGGITKNKDGSYSINDKTNHVSYTKGTEGSSETYANDGVQESALIIASGKPKETTNWYGPGGQANWAFGTGATLSGFKGVLNSDQMYSQGIRRGLSGNYQLTGRNLSLFGKSAMTDATVPISKFGKWGGIAGKASFFAGVAMDGVGVYNYTQNPNSPNAVHPAKAGLNTTMGAIGVWGGPPGAVVSAAYFGIDAFYPGGWAGAAADQDRLYQENKAINPDYQMFPGAMKQ